MATYALAPGEHGAYAKTLVANVLDTVTFADPSRMIEVFSNGANALYVTIDGHTPTVADPRSWELPAAGPVARTLTLPIPAQATVKLISAGPVVYSVSRGLT